MSDVVNAPENELMSMDEYRRIRLEKIHLLREKGINPYAERFDRTHLLSEAHVLSDTTPNVSVAGRILTMRIMGNLSFVTIKDFSGRFQLAFNKSVVGEETYNSIFKKCVDIGDFIGATGDIFTTKTGEKTLRVGTLTFLSKSLRPLPEKFHGVQDTEIKYRQRYLDLIMNDDTLARFKLRSRVVKTIRSILEENHFVEVDTPVLCNQASGAIARPFITHHNTLGMDVFLRIAPETYLKRLIAGGFDRVYEFARCFRNEGVSVNHLQDFTMLEFYAAYWNYRDNMAFTQTLIQKTVQTIFGTMTIDIAGQPIDFGGQWPEVSFKDLVLKDCGINLDDFPTDATLRAEIKRRGIILDAEHFDKLSYGNIVDHLYKKMSRPKLTGPVFLLNHPIETSPLARQNDADPKIADRFQLVVNGVEILNAYSELVDPVDQTQRLREQAASKGKGDDEAMAMDSDFIKCMEYGMPPISGWGLGIDRFCQLITNSENIRDVVLFPLMRPLE